METTNWGETTQLAFSTIEDDLLLQMNNEDSYLDPLVVLDYLHDNDNFKKLPDILKERMVKSNVCAEDDTLKDCSIILNELLAQQDLTYSREQLRSPVTIDRWFGVSKPTTDVIRNRDDVISICFALELNFTDANDFLNKCGHAALNIRDAEDATYSYCLVNHRPLSAAKRILTDYNRSVQNEEKTDNETDPEVLSCGNTTNLLRNQIIKESSWINDSDFLEKFLLVNKSSFISYSKTALNEYLKLSNPIYLFALRYLLADEQGYFEKRSIEAYIHQSQKDFEITVPKQNVQQTKRFLSKLESHSSKLLVLQEAQNMVSFHVINKSPGEKKTRDNCVVEENNILDVVDYISSRLIDYENDDNAQAYLFRFLSDAVPANRLLEAWLPSLTAEAKNRQVSYTKSSLKDTVMKDFPHRQFFTGYEKHPEEYIHSNALRKTIILLYYMTYAQNFLADIGLSDYIGQQEMAFGLDSFMETLNSILMRCQLGTLYPANQFDWLILQSVEKFDITPRSQFEDEEDTPIAFLDQVIEYAWEDD